MPWPYEPGSMVLPDEPAKAHLGGNIAGGDLLTQYPEMWRRIAGDLNVTSVLDIGCGDGAAMLEWREILGPGGTIHGVDGWHENVHLAKQSNLDVHEHDFAIGPYTTPRREYDLGWCCEVLEHLTPVALTHAISVFTACKFLAVTHAMPGQSGHHHVNCQLPRYWIRFFKDIGFICEPNLTLTARWLCPQRSYFFNTGLIFTRSPRAA